MPSLRKLELAVGHPDDLPYDSYDPMDRPASTVMSLASSSTPALETVTLSFPYPEFGHEFDVKRRRSTRTWRIDRRDLFELRLEEVSHRDRIAANISFSASERY